MARFDLFANTDPRASHGLYLDVQSDLVQTPTRWCVPMRRWRSDRPLLRGAQQLIQVDEDSIRGLDARKINPIDRTYLAKVITTAQTLKPQVMSIDFLLDRPTTEDQPLAQAVQAATQQGQWLLFSAQLKANRREIGVIPTIGNPNSTRPTSLANLPCHRYLRQPQLVSTTILYCLQVNMVPH